MGSIPTVSSKANILIPMNSATMALVMKKADRKRKRRTPLSCRRFFMFSVVRTRIEGKKDNLRCPLLISQYFQHLVLSAVFLRQQICLTSLLRQLSMPISLSPSLIDFTSRLGTASGKGSARKS